MKDHYWFSRAELTQDSTLLDQPKSHPESSSPICGDSQSLIDKNSFTATTPTTTTKTNDDVDSSYGENNIDRNRTSRHETNFRKTRNTKPDSTEIDEHLGRFEHEIGELASELGRRSSWPDSNWLRETSPVAGSEHTIPSPAGKPDRRMNGEQRKLLRRAKSALASTSGSRDTDLLNLSFCGCGFLGIYHVGVASCFHEYAPQLSMHKIAGSSAGALVAVAHLSGNLSLAYCVTDILRVAIDARSRALGPLHPSFDINGLVREALERGLPSDVHQRASGRLHISLTRVDDGQNVIISHFDSKEDVIQALLCSCFIPFWSGLTLPKFKGVSYMDGGFSNNLLNLDAHTVSVSPFAGEADICPRDDTFNLLQVSLSNTSFSLSPNNLYRLSHALMPPPPEVLSDICEQGFADGVRFLQRLKLISCTKCLQIRSSLLVTSNGEDMEAAFSGAADQLAATNEQAQSAYVNEQIRLQRQQEKTIEMVNGRERKNSVVSRRSQFYKADDGTTTTTTSRTTTTTTTSGSIRLVSTDSFGKRIRRPRRTRMADCNKATKTRFALERHVEATDNKWPIMSSQQAITNPTSALASSLAPESIITTSTTTTTALTNDNNNNLNSSDLTQLYSAKKTQTPNRLSATAVFANGDEQEDETGSQKHQQQQQMVPNHHSGGIRSDEIQDNDSRSAENRNNGHNNKRSADEREIETDFDDEQDGDQFEQDQEQDHSIDQDQDDDEADEFDDNCDECVQIRQRVLRRRPNLPKHFSDRIRDACDQVNKSLSNWIYSHRPIKYLSYLATPYLLPLDLSLALVCRCWHGLPAMSNELVGCIIQIGRLLLAIMRRMREGQTITSMLMSPAPFQWEQDAMEYDKQLCRRPRYQDSQPSPVEIISTANPQPRTTILQQQYQQKQEPHPVASTKEKPHQHLRTATDDPETFAKGPTLPKVDGEPSEELITSAATHHHRHHQHHSHRPLPASTRTRRASLMNLSSSTFASSVGLSSCQSVETPAIAVKITSDGVCVSKQPAGGGSQLHSLEDTFDSIVDVTSNQEARILTYYFRDAKNRLQVTEIFDLQRASNQSTKD